MIYTQLYGIKYSYQIQIIFNQIYLTHRWNPNRYYYWSVPMSNNNDRVLHIPQSSRTGDLPSDGAKCHTQDTQFEGSLISR